MSKHQKIKDISGLLGEPRIIEEWLAQLEPCLNFDYFLEKIEKELKNKKLDIISEIRCAYILKKVLGFKVEFMPESLKHGEIIPSSKINRNYNEIKKPDIWVVYKGNWFYVEVKKIRMDKMDSLRSVYDHSYNFEKATQITTSRIIGEFKSATKQIKNFGQGYVYIECERSKVNIEAIDNEIREIFKNHDNIMGLILVYQRFNEEKILLVPKFKVFNNVFFKRDIDLYRH